MKVCVIQPPYSAEYEKSDDYFNFVIERLDECDDSIDVIVTPENCDIPCLAKTKELEERSVEKYNAPLLKRLQKHDICI